MPIDKQKHLIAGFVISLIVTQATGNRQLGILAGNLAGIAKDFIWDKWLKKGHFEWADIAYTGWGAGLGAMI
jgi:hypothetical protein